MHFFIFNIMIFLFFIYTFITNLYSIDEECNKSKTNKTGEIIKKLEDFENNLLIDKESIKHSKEYLNDILKISNNLKEKFENGFIYYENNDSLESRNKYKDIELKEINKSDISIEINTNNEEVLVYDDSKEFFYGDFEIFFNKKFTKKEKKSRKNKNVDKEKKSSLFLIDKYCSIQ